MPQVSDVLDEVEFISGGNLQCVVGDGHEWPAADIHRAERELKEQGLPSDLGHALRHLCPQGYGCKKDGCKGRYAVKPLSNRG